MACSGMFTTVSRAYICLLILTLQGDEVRSCDHEYINVTYLQSCVANSAL